MSDRSGIYTVVMAGGRGERFWPQSRQNCPKQLLHLLGNLTLIEQTTARMLSICDPQNCLVVTNKDYVEPMRSLLPMLPAENIIGEPVGRDTGGCLALAAGVLDSRGVPDDAVVIATPADHKIENVTALSCTLLKAAAVAEECDAPVLIGVKPDFASTGYGYIRCSNRLDYGNELIGFYAADGFREKPSITEAEDMLQEPCWLWNSGIFVWKHGVFKSKLTEYAPELAVITREVGLIHDVRKLDDFLREEFAFTPDISIDYALLEKLDYMVVAECKFDWADIGSWTALRNQIKADENNNAIHGLHAGLDTENCIIVSENQHLIATIDVKDLVIVKQRDVTLVCSEKSSQRVKELVQQLGKDPKYHNFL